MRKHFNLLTGMLCLFTLICVGCSNSFSGTMSGENPANSLTITMMKLLLKNHHLLSMLIPVLLLQNSIQLHLPFSIIFMVMQKMDLLWVLKKLIFRKIPTIIKKVL